MGCEAGTHGPLGTAVVSEWKFLSEIWCKLALSLVADILGWYVVHSYMKNHQIMNWKTGTLRWVFIYFFKMTWIFSVNCFLLCKLSDTF